MCESKFENHLVAVPEPVTFHEASFICDFLSGKIFSVDDDLYDADGLYQKLMSELGLKVRPIDQKNVYYYESVLTLNTYQEVKRYIF